MKRKSEVMTLKKISLNEFLRLRKLVYRNARPIDYTKWKFLFENGSCDDFLLVLSGYQNADGGFGHNTATYPSWLPLPVYFVGSPESNSHPDGKWWCVAEQTIGNYYWGSNFIIRDLDILRKFDRLDFDLPVLI